MALKILVSYAYRDKILVDDLRRHLLPLERQGLIDIWQDAEIAPGGGWSQAIDKHLNTADIILLMLSPDFLNSDYCYSAEMKQVLKRHQEGEAWVIPIILRPVHWQASPVAELQALPQDAQPVTSWANREQAFYNIAMGIRHITEEILVHENFKLNLYGINQNLPGGIDMDEATQNIVTFSSVIPRSLEASFINVFVESPSGERFSVEAPSNMSIGQLAADFFESQGWAVADHFRHRRAIVDLVNPENPDDTKRLNLHWTINDTCREGDTVRITPEATAGCFPLGTLIRMADGGQTPIELIKIDDEVMSWDLERRRHVSASIIGIHKEQAAPILLLINNQLKLSVSQPVWVNSSWKFAKDIRVGDQLMGLNRQVIASHNVDPVENLFDNQQQEVTNLGTSSIARLFDDQITIHDISPLGGIFDVRHLSTFGGIPFFAEDILVQPYNTVDTTSVGQSITKQAFKG